MSTGFDYSDILARATFQVTDKGRDVILFRASRAVDAGDTWLTQQGSSVAAVAAEQNITVKAVFDQKQITDESGETIQRTIQVAFISPNALILEDLTTDYEIIDGALRYRVTRVNPIKPGATLLLYELELGA